MNVDIAIKGDTDIEVIKHRIYEVRGLRLRSQFVTSSLGMANIENHTQFAVKNFDRKTILIIVLEEMGNRKQLKQLNVIKQ